MTLLETVTDIIVGNSTDIDKIESSFLEVINNIEANTLPLIKMHPSQKFEGKHNDKIAKAILSQPNVKGNDAFKVVKDVVQLLVLDKEHYVKNLRNLAIINKHSRSLELAEFTTLISALTSTLNYITKMISLDVAVMANRPYAKIERIWLKELEEREVPDLIALTINAFAFGCDDLSKTMEAARYIKASSTGSAKELPKDGTQANLIPGIGNIVVWFGKHFNSVAAIMYQRDKAFRDRLALDILMLEERKNDEVDQEAVDRIQKQIDYYTNLITKLETKLELTEESSYGN